MSASRREPPQAGRIDAAWRTARTQGHGLIAAMLVLSLTAAWGIVAAPRRVTGGEARRREHVEMPVVARAGGSATIDDASGNAFGFPSPALSGDERRAFAVGNSFFRQNWVEAPSSTAARDGLGPLFNARSCSACHSKDGRSRPPEPAETDREGLLVRLGVRAEGAADRPHPVYGDQVQDQAVLGVHAEARVEIRWTLEAGEYGDGSPFELAAPHESLVDPAYGPLGDDIVLSGRTAPHLIGLGLLESIPDAAILAHEDPEDRDGDGISGRAHRLPGAAGNTLPSKTARIGRFGWKAAQPDVAAQCAAAFVNDMGITSSRLPIESTTARERETIDAVFGGAPEIEDKTFERVVFYTRVLAVPAARDSANEQGRRGRQLFADIGCAACHVPSYVTSDSAFHPAYAHQTIAPWTDLLLHDLGPGLADGKRDGDAGPQEWRTPPLWGIGLFPAVNGHSRYLHDGRARNLAEAILWHGGEGHAAREHFRLAPLSDREALLAFVASL